MLSVGTIAPSETLRSARRRSCDVVARAPRKATGRKTSSSRLRVASVSTPDSSTRRDGGQRPRPSVRKSNQANRPKKKTDRPVSMPLTYDHGAVSVTSTVEAESLDMARS